MEEVNGMKGGQANVGLERCRGTTYRTRTRRSCRSRSRAWKPLRCVLGGCGGEMEGRAEVAERSGCREAMEEEAGLVKCEV